MIRSSLNILFKSTIKNSSKIPKIDLLNLIFSGKYTTHAQKNFSIRNLNFVPQFPFSTNQQSEVSQL